MDNRDSKNNAKEVTHDDFVQLIHLQDMMNSQKDITQLRHIGERLEGIFGDDEKDYPHVQK